MAANLSQEQQAVLATLAYHDILDMPLTATEIWRYLFRENGVENVGEHLCVLPRTAARDPRFDKRADAEVRPYDELFRTLCSLVECGKIAFHWGYYFFPGRQDLVEKRLYLHKLAQTKWPRLRFVAWFLQAIPFLEMVAASGSMAREMTHKDSDLDVLLITRSGRIWTVRFLVTVLLDLFKLRRRPTGPTRNLVCLNHYLAHDALALPYQSLYTALEYARVIPLFGEKVCVEFREANRPWMEKYLARVLPDEVPNLKQVKTSVILSAIKTALEFTLSGTIGDWLENWLGRQQKTRIEKNEKETIGGGRIVASAMHLEFHPHSKEAPLLKRFNERMTETGLESFGGQKDSGLN
jgi:hypothetical protein